MIDNQFILNIQWNSILHVTLSTEIALTLDTFKLENNTLHVNRSTYTNRCCIYLSHSNSRRERLLLSKHALGVQYLHKNVSIKRHLRHSETVYLVLLRADTLKNTPNKS